jgi:hypothetical protein
LISEDATGISSFETEESMETKSGFDKTAIVVAIIGAIASIIVAYIAATMAGKSAGASAGSAKAASLAPVPKGTVAFFNMSDCPKEWRARADAEGRYLVGLNSKFQGSLSQVVGSPLNNLENRATGAHTHTYKYFSAGGDGKSGNKFLSWGNAGGAGRVFSDLQTTPPTANAGESDNTHGTNAPYLQLLVCEKA